MKDALGAVALFGRSAEELRAVVEGLGLPKYRAVQLGDALYKQRVEKLARAYEEGKPYLQSRWRWPDRFNP